MEWVHSTSQVLDVCVLPLACAACALIEKWKSWACPQASLLLIALPQGRALFTQQIVGEGNEQEGLMSPMEEQRQDTEFCTSDISSRLHHK